MSSSKRSQGVGLSRYAPQAAASSPRQRARHAASSVLAAEQNATAALGLAGTSNAPPSGGGAASAGGVSVGSAPHDAPVNDSVHATAARQRPTRRWWAEERCCRRERDTPAGRPTGPKMTPRRSA